MKKLFALVLSTLLIFTACGEEGDSGATETTPAASSTTEATTEKEEETSATETEEPTVEPMSELQPTEIPYTTFDISDYQIGQYIGYFQITDIVFEEDNYAYLELEGELVTYATLHTQDIAFEYGLVPENPLFYADFIALYPDLAHSIDYLYTSEEDLLRYWDEDTIPYLHEMQVPIKITRLYLNFNYESSNSFWCDYEVLGISDKTEDIPAYDLAEIEIGDEIGNFTVTEKIFSNTDTDKQAYLVLEGEAYTFVHIPTYGAYEYEIVPHESILDGRFITYYPDDGTNGIQLNTLYTTEEDLLRYYSSDQLQNPDKPYVDLAQYAIITKIIISDYYESEWSVWAEYELSGYEFITKDPTNVYDYRDIEIGHEIGGFTVTDINLSIGGDEESQFYYPMYTANIALEGEAYTRARIFYDFGLYEYSLQLEENVLDAGFLIGYGTKPSTYVSTPLDTSEAIELLGEDNLPTYGNHSEWFDIKITGISYGTMPETSDYTSITFERAE